MIKKIIKLALLLSIIPASMLAYNETLYFTGWEDNVSTPDNKAPVHFYVINLDRQPERFVKFKANSDKFGVEVERISATDGYQVTFVDQKTKEVFTGTDIKNKSKTFLPQHKYDVYCSSSSYVNKDPAEFVYDAFQELDRGLTAGEIGLTCSARLLWQKISNTPQHQIAIILEDDAILLDNFDQTFKKFINTLPTKWDIAYLGADIFPLEEDFPYSLRWNLHFPNLVINNHFSKIHTHSNIYGTYGYAINKDSAQKLLMMHSFHSSLPLDEMFGKSIRKMSLTAYITTLNIISHDFDSKSEISTMGRKEFGN